MESTERTYDWLNYHHLRYFYAIAKEGSVRKAAEKLHASQSSICAQVKQFETDLGDTLYRRTGRSIALTEFGWTIFRYAEEIFELGNELLKTSRRSPGRRLIRLDVGILDSFPKLLSLDILRPVFSQKPPIHVACQEGKFEDLLAKLAAHRLDALLADEPAPSGVKFKTFHHWLGSSGISFCASSSLASSLSGRFPRKLHEAPMLLPMPHSAVRRDLDGWFRSKGLAPEVIGEFEDGALAKIVAAEGIGIAVVPTLVEQDAINRYGFVVLGRTRECQIPFYLITGERRLEHPGVDQILKDPRRKLLNPEGKVKAVPD